MALGGDLGPPPKQEQQQQQHKQQEEGQGEELSRPLIGTTGGGGGRSGTDRPKVSRLVAVCGAALDVAEWALNWLVYTPRENLYLSGVFAPVPEAKTVSRSLRVTGELPACLSGEFVRNGPNPKYRPTAGYHLFDGDGMLHGVRIKDGQATYVNRFVRTSRLEQEDAYGRAMFMKFGDMQGFAGLLHLMLYGLRKKLGILDESKGSGTANTAMVFHNGALMALHEGDAPYIVRVLRDGDFETVGRSTYGGTLQHTFTAHPKLDPQTGELFLFGYCVEKPPYLTYRTVSKEGEMGPPVPITLPDPVMMHDFAITEKYAVFLDFPLVFRPQAMFDRASGGLPFMWDDKRAARFGVLPRYDTSEAAIRWFELPAQFAFHVGNAWEEGDEVVVVLCRFHKFSLVLETSFRNGWAQLYEYRFNLKTGECMERQLSDFGCEFPRINERYLGRKNRFVYCAVFGKRLGVAGVVKVDLSKAPLLADGGLGVHPGFWKGNELPFPEVGGNVAGWVPWGPQRHGSEPVFVARDASSLSAEEEDNGFLLNFVFDGRTNLSEVVVIDARTMAPQPVAVIHLEVRVPSGFHGIFVSEEQLKLQDEADLEDLVQA